MEKLQWICFVKKNCPSTFPRSILRTYLAFAFLLIFVSTNFTSGKSGHLCMGPTASVTKAGRKGQNLEVLYNVFFLNLTHSGVFVLKKTRALILVHGEAVCLKHSAQLKSKQMFVHTNLIFWPHCQA